MREVVFYDYLVIMKAAHLANPDAWWAALYSFSSWVCFYHFHAAKIGKERPDVEFLDKNNGSKDKISCFLPLFYALI